MSDYKRNKKIIFPHKTQKEREGERAEMRKYKVKDILSWIH